MQKIPTFLERDWDGDRSRVLDQIADGCDWVARGEGVATRKYDGTSCAVISGRLYKRQELDGTLTADPPNTFVVDHSTKQRGKGENVQVIPTTILWVAVDDGPEDKWHREAFAQQLLGSGVYPVDGTYELLGPKIQGNPEGFPLHTLLRHANAEVLDDAPRTFDELAEYFTTHQIEGIVWHHPDGRMAKIKARDFGIKRLKR